MSTIAPISVGSGYLYVEVEEAEVGATPQAREVTGKHFQDTPDDAELIGFKDDLDEAATALRSTIGALASDVAEALARAAPAEWTLEFNIGFKGKVNPIPVIVSSEGSASLKLKATWRQE